MGRGNERKWTKQAIRDEYRTHAGPRVADRVAEVMERAEQAGRLHFGSGTSTPALGILGDCGEQILSIREHFQGRHEGRISAFLRPSVWASEAQREVACSRLHAIAKLGADFDRIGSVDVTDLTRLSDDEYAEFLALLDWLGPLRAVTAPDAI
jgi:hypothetical protein